MKLNSMNIEHRTSNVQPRTELRSMFSVRAVFLLAICFCLGACSSTKPRPEPARPRIQAEQAYEAGKSEYRQQHWAAAAQSFQKAADGFAVLDDFATEATARHNQ